jgi:hypothetical protein
MASPLESAISQAIASGFKGLLLTGTIRRETVGSLTDEGDPVTTFTDYPFEGIRDNFSAYYAATAGIPVTDARILIIAGLCPIIPAQDDKIKIGGAWYQVRRITEIDPATATYTLAGFAIAAP